MFSSFFDQQVTLSSSYLSLEVLSSPCLGQKTSLLGSEALCPRFLFEPITGGFPVSGDRLAMTPIDPHGRDARNLVEAASAGAAISVKVVANIAANLIAILAVLAFINAALSWLGDMVDIQGLSFQVWLWRRGGSRDRERRTETLSDPDLFILSAHLLLRPAACGLLDGRGLGGLSGGGRAAGRQTVSE